MKLSPAERLIVALDVGTLEEATRLVQALAPLGVKHFKVGLGLFTLEGPRSIEAVQRLGGKVFLDLKFHDIPSTVSRAVQAAVRLGVWMTNLHIQGGGVMMRQAVLALREESTRRKQPAPLLVGVTVLTSMAQKDFADLGLRKTLKDQVLYLSRLAQSAGLDGIVASAQEAQVVRWTCGENFLIVAPGIRPGGESADPFLAKGARPKDDQSRAATPQEALRAGADYLVVGRPIWEASDPMGVTQGILRELEKEVKKA